ncbi:MAG: T9SS type A sorting domain-containing protein [Patescibacteria group bacterium]
MKTFKKILFFVIVLCIFPPVNFSQQESNIIDTSWTLNLPGFGITNSDTKTYKNPNGSRVFINSGTPDTLFGASFLGVFWYRIFSPNLKVPYAISAEFKLESGINLDSVETFLTLEDSLRHGHFYGEKNQPLLNSEWQTLTWDVKKYENNPQYNLVSVKVLQFSFQNRSRAPYVKSVICVRNIKKINIDNSFSIIDLGVITDVPHGNLIPTEFKLEQNYPNPFNPTTTIKFSIPESGNYTLRVYNTLGQEVATLVNEYKIVGNYEINFNAGDLPSGVYMYKLQAGSFVQTKKMILIK